MIDGTKILTPKRAQNILSPENVDRLYELYTNYQDEEDYAKVVTLSDIEAKGFDLSPNKYVEYHKEAIRPYAEVLAEFKAAYEEVLLREKEFEQLMNI
jgi:type I restriction enzyme M protein